MGEAGTVKSVRSTPLCIARVKLDIRLTPQAKISIYWTPGSKDEGSDPSG